MDVGFCFSIQNSIYIEFFYVKSVAEQTAKVDRIDKTVTKIENEHGEKFSVLFDEYKQNSDKLDRIEQEVSKHEKIILRRVRP